ncbi:MAG: tautomerase family protein [Candidatus Eremiobacteraeota bacterium]|nr:tautomerase family protein [Candidatus Eremiobacteraeota bacterium]
MPFVRISLSPGYEDADARGVADGVHEALVQAVDVPAADRFQVVLRRKADEMIWDRTYLGVERSDRAVFVEITLAFGRDDDKKRALYAAIVRNIAAKSAVRPEDVLIVLTEVSRSNWSFGNGIAHYAPGDAAPAVSSGSAK